MMKYTPKQQEPKLTDTEVMEEACTILSDNLPLTADGYVCTGNDLWQILLGVSAKKTTMAPRSHGGPHGLGHLPRDVCELGGCTE